MPHSQPSRGGSEGAPPRRRQHRGRTSNTAPSGSRARFDLGSSRAEAGPGEEGWDDVALSHAATKNNPSFKGFFEQLDDLTLKAMDDRDWACPACHGGGPRFKGLQPLLSHAKDVASHRVPLHRALGHVLEAELKRRLAACLLTRGALATWMAPRGPAHVVWPPMVIVQNTHWEAADRLKWQGIGNSGLLECFKGYKPIKARQGYGLNGHQGTSVLVFESSVTGYLEADRLHRHFLQEGRGKEDWYNRPSRILSLPSGGKRVLYGYMATRDEMEIFNKNFQDRAKVKYDMVSYESMVVEPMKKMKDNSEKLAWLETKVVEDQERTKALEEVANRMAQKFDMQESEAKLMIRKYTEKVNELKIELDYMEHAYKQEIEQLSQDLAVKDQELGNIRKELEAKHI